MVPPPISVNQIHNNQSEITQIISQIRNTTKKAGNSQNGIAIKVKEKYELQLKTNHQQNLQSQVDRKIDKGRKMHKNY